MDIEIIFEGRKMAANISNGMIFNANISGATAVLPDILSRKKTLLLDGHISGITKDLTLFVDQSPLKNNLAIFEVRKAMERGEFELDLELGVPIKQPGRKPDVDGTIYLSNADLYAPTLKMHITDVNGSVTFSRESVLSETMKAMYLDKPVTITVAGRMNDPQNPPIFSLKGNGTDRFIIDRLLTYVPSVSPLEDYLLARITGTTDFKVNLGIQQNEDNKTVTKTLEISSNLQGLTMDLPEPLNKTTDRIRSLRIRTDLSETGKQKVEVNLDSAVSSQLILDKDAEFKLQEATIKFGPDDEKPEGTHNLQVYGSIYQLSVQNWIEIIKLLTKENEKPHPVFLDTKIAVNVTNLDLFRHIYNDVKVFGNKHDENWLFKLDGGDIKGDVILPTKMERDRIINLQMEKLVISEKTEEGVQAYLDPVSIPSIIINIDDFKFRDYEMGKFLMTSSVTENGLSLDQFEFSKPDLIIHGDGKWLSIAGEDVSRFNIYLTAENMEAMLKTFAYDITPVKNGKTTLTIDAVWTGAPMDFAFQNLNGNLDMHIEKGQFLDIDPSAGRLFGLLSIQTLPRRLLLDFSDIFGKGLTFDSIEGEFEITDGNAYTNDLYMRGPSADITVTGRTGLADKDYDQVVTVTPQIANSLPVASALFGPVGIGVGAVIYLFNSLNDNIDKLLRYQYTITGNWDNPVIKKIKDKEVVANVDSPTP